MSSSVKTIYLDCDGVFANFTKAANKLHGFENEPPPTTWNWYEKWGLTKEEFWAPINAIGDEFYPLHVPAYQWTAQLFHALKEFLAKHKDVQLKVATANSDNVGANGKIEWIKAQLRAAGLHNVEVILISSKDLLAPGGGLLIDDNLDNCRAFEKAGGKTFIWPQPWNGGGVNSFTIPFLVDTLAEWANPPAPAKTLLTVDKQERKDTPITTGCLDYFPLAIAEVARLSRIGNEQHNPGQPLHWDKTKSTDHADCVARHLLERGTIDTDGQRHSTKVAWRALALLQIELESS